MVRILVVEQDAHVARSLRQNLEIEGYKVDIAPDAERGFELAERVDLDLVVLDVDQMEPGLLQRIRTLRDSRTPLLAITANGSSESGHRRDVEADAYLTRPFGVLELLTRVESLVALRSQKRKQNGSGRDRFGDISIDRSARIVARHGVEVRLTPKEFDLLVALYDRRGTVVSRNALLQLVWGYHEGVVSRTVDTHIAELRRKLETDPTTPAHILTVRSSGYQLATNA